MTDIPAPSESDRLSAGLIAKFEARSATLGVIGLGYVGLPLARAAINAGFRVRGVDTDPAKIEALNAGRSYIDRFPDATVEAMQATGRFEVTTQHEALGDADAILICVPTPLTRHREPDLRFVTGTVERLVRALRAGQVVVLESTTYPGTTREVVQPMLEAGGLVAGETVFLGYSPEREDPGNADFSTHSIPKVVGADDPTSLAVVQRLYEQLVVSTVPVSSAATAEAVKLTENIFRSVNVALVNEMKVIFDRMGIDVWEVIGAAKTKPFGYMPFYPGPGLGGHCIPIDPFYLTWKAREYGVTTRFIELAGEINTAMPAYVVERVALALDQSIQRGLNGADILLIGLAYKKNVDDLRESPSLRLLALLEARGATVRYHDPYLPVVPITRDHAAIAGRRSVELSDEIIRAADVVLIATDHDGIDYQAIADHASLVVDTRNAMARTQPSRAKIVKS